MYRYLHCNFLLQRHSYIAHFSYKDIVTLLYLHCTFFLQRYCYIAVLTLHISIITWLYLHCTFLLQWPFLYRPGSLHQLLFWDALIARGPPVPTSIKHYHGQKRFVVTNTYRYINKIYPLKNWNVMALLKFVCKETGKIKILHKSRTFVEMYRLIIQIISMITVCKLPVLE